MRKLISLISVCLLMTSPALAVMEFQIAPGLNSFSDIRVSGQSTAFAIMFDLGTTKAGFLTEGGNYVVTDEINSANNFSAMVSIKGVRFLREVLSLGSLATKIGLDIGSADITGQAGSVAVPAGFNQIAPLYGILANITYEAKKDKISTSLFLNIGYRILDIKDVAVPFGGVTRKLSDMNSLFGNIGVGMEF